MGKLLVKTAIGALAVTVLASVFMLYTSPAFMVNLAEQVWSCF